MTFRRVYPGCGVLDAFRSSKIEIGERFFGPRKHALPTAEDLIAYDRITLYSTKFAAFIKSPLDIGTRGSRGAPAAFSGPALSKCTLFEDPATRPSPNFNAAHGGLWLPIFPGKRFLLEFRSPTANGEPLWWRTNVLSRRFGLIWRWCTKTYRIEWSLLLLLPPRNFYDILRQTRILLRILNDFLYLYFTAMQKFSVSQQHFAKVLQK